MSFWLDPLRVIGNVTTPILVAIGIGLPDEIMANLPIAGANIGTDGVDRAAENAAADRRAAEAEKRAQEANLQRQLAHAALPQNALTASQKSDLHMLETLLSHPDDSQLAQLRLAPPSACKDATGQDKAKPYPM